MRPTDQGDKARTFPGVKGEGKPHSGRRLNIGTREETQDARIVFMPPPAGQGYLQSEQSWETWLKCFKMGAAQKKSRLLSRETEREQWRELLLIVVASAGNCYFSIVSNKIRVGGERGRNTRQSQEAVSLDKKRWFVISISGCHAKARVGLSSVSPGHSDTSPL